MNKIPAVIVHIYTASGMVLAALAAAELWRDEPSARTVFALLLAAVAVDATDGVLARRWRVKLRMPQIDGRVIDDIVDYLTFVLVPLLLAWRLEWIPGPAILWIAPALVASLFGFANAQAKQEDSGFFLGFPSYWNIVVYYAGIFVESVGRTTIGVILVALAVLTVAPVRFIYPTLAPGKWRPWILIGAIVWAALLAAMLPSYPSPPGWLIALSMVYPTIYIAGSIYADREDRRRRNAP